MKLADIQTEYPSEENESWAEWLTIHVDDEDGHVSFRHEYTNGRDPERNVWPDMGSGFSAKHLDAVDALIRAQAAQASPSGGKTKP